MIVMPMGGNCSLTSDATSTPRDVRSVKCDRVPGLSIYARINDDPVAIADVNDNALTNSRTEDGDL